MWAFFNSFRETPAQTTSNLYDDPAKMMANIYEWIRRANPSLTTQESEVIIQQAIKCHDLNIAEVTSSRLFKANAEDILLRLLDLYIALASSGQSLKQVAEKVDEIFRALNHFSEHAKEKGIAKVLDAIRSLVKHDHGLDLVQAHLEQITLKVFNEPINWSFLVKVRFICDDLLEKRRALTTVQNISLVLNQHSNPSIQKVGIELQTVVFAKLMNAFSGLLPDKGSPVRSVFDDVERQFNIRRASPDSLRREDIQTGAEDRSRDGCRQSTVQRPNQELSTMIPQKKHQKRKKVRFDRGPSLQALSPNLSRRAQIASRRPTPMPVRMHLPGSGKENVPQVVNASLEGRKFETLSPSTPKVVKMHMGRRGGKVAQETRALKDMAVSPKMPRPVSSSFHLPLYSAYGVTISLRPVAPSEDLSNPYLNSKAAITTIDQWITQAQSSFLLENPHEILRDASVFHRLHLSKIGRSQGSYFRAETEDIFLKLLDLYCVFANSGTAPKQVSKKVDEIFRALGHFSRPAREKGIAKVLDVIQNLLSCDEGFDLVHHHLISMTCNALSDPIQEHHLSKIGSICEYLIKKNREQALVKKITSLIFNYWKKSKYRIKLPRFIDQLI